MLLDCFSAAEAAGGFVKTRDNRWAAGAGVLAERQWWRQQPGGVGVRHCRHQQCTPYLRTCPPCPQDAPLQPADADGQAAEAAVLEECRWVLVGVGSGHLLPRYNCALACSPPALLCHLVIESLVPCCPALQPRRCASQTSSLAPSWKLWPPPTACACSAWCVPAGCCYCCP